MQVQACIRIPETEPAAAKPPISSTGGPETAKLLGLQGALGGRLGGGGPVNDQLHGHLSPGRQFPQEALMRRQLIVAIGKFSAWCMQRRSSLAHQDTVSHPHGM